MPYPIVPTDPGVTRQVLAENESMMLVAFRFEQGAEGKLHSHAHVQGTFVEAGRFSFSLNDETYELGPGDSLVIPSGARHGCICRKAGTLIDTFAPRRDDFL